LRSLSAAYPHPAGMIEVKYQRRGAGIDATITLPNKLEGEFSFQGKTSKLTPGVNHITVD